jgi:hypothetical protein
MPLTSARPHSDSICSGAAAAAGATRCQHRQAAGGRGRPRHRPGQATPPGWRPGRRGTPPLSAAPHPRRRPDVVRVAVAQLAALALAPGVGLTSGEDGARVELASVERHDRRAVQLQQRRGPRDQRQALDAALPLDVAAPARLQGRGMPGWRARRAVCGGEPRGRRRGAAGIAWRGAAAGGGGGKGRVQSAWQAMGQLTSPAPTAGGPRTLSPPPARAPSGRAARAIAAATA